MELIIRGVTRSVNGRPEMRSEQEDACRAVRSILALVVALAHCPLPLVSDESQHHPSDRYRTEDVPLSLRFFLDGVGLTGDESLVHGSDLRGGTGGEPDRFASFGEVAFRFVQNYVGARAGVSYQTVSRLLNGSGPVSVAARPRIAAAIVDLGYSPDPTARNLMTKQSQVIGIITATYEGNACVQTLEGATTGFQDAGYSVVIGGGEQRSRHEPDMLPLLKHQRVAGFLVTYSGLQAATHRLLTKIPPGIPVVTTGYAQDRANIVAVRVQTEDGARAATRHLINLGHRQIAAVTGVPEVYETIQRDNGYRAALEEAGIPHRDELIISKDWFVENGYDATRRLLQRKTPFTAIFAHSDRMAIGCIRALFDHGPGVPKDVAVVGFNDISLARFVTPPLTTVHHPLYQLGAVCASLLMGLIAGQSKTELAAIQQRASLLHPQLVICQSCGAQIAPCGSQISTSNV